MIATVITTAPRPRECYLPRTVASLMQAGFAAPLILAEPESPVAESIRQSCELLVNPRRLGEWANRLQAIRLGLQMPDLDALLLVEDDVIFCRHVHELIAAELWPSERCGAIQIYTSRRYRHDLPLGLNLLPKRRMPGLSSACAMAFRPQAAADVLSHGELIGWLSDERTDEFFGQALLASKWEVWCHNPSLAFHIGVESHSGHGGPHGGRREIAWHGEEADAREIWHG